MPGTLPIEALPWIDAEPADVTFVDAESVVRYFSEYRIFSRPMSCLDRDVLLCHNELTRPGIKHMLAEFRDGWRDEAVFLAQKNGRDVDVVYSAVRDAEGRYVGCIEVSRWREAE